MNDLIERLSTAEEMDGDTFLDMMDAGLLREAADALKAKDNEIERLRKELMCVSDDSAMQQMQADAEIERMKPVIDAARKVFLTQGYIDDVTLGALDKALEDYDEVSDELDKT